MYHVPLGACWTNVRTAGRGGEAPQVSRRVWGAQANNSKKMNHPVKHPVVEMSYRMIMLNYRMPCCNPVFGKHPCEHT